MAEGEPLEFLVTPGAGLVIKKDGIDVHTTPSRDVPDDDLPEMPTGTPGSTVKAGLFYSQDSLDALQSALKEGRPIIFRFQEPDA